MAVTEIPARDFTFEVNTGTVGAPDWVAIGGLDTWSYSNSDVDTDTTTFDDDGDQSHFVMSRGREYTLTGKAQEDPATGDRDEGQEAVEAWATEKGTDSLKQFRVTSPGGTVYTMMASAKVTGPGGGGGGNDDVSSWSATIRRSGATTVS